MDWISAVTRERSYSAVRFDEPRMDWEMDKKNENRFPGISRTPLSGSNEAQNETRRQGGASYVQNREAKERTFGTPFSGSIEVQPQNR